MTTNKQTMAQYLEKMEKKEKLKYLEENKRSAEKARNCIAPEKMTPNEVFGIIAILEHGTNELKLDNELMKMNKKQLVNIIIMRNEDIAYLKSELKKTRGGK